MEVVICMPALIYVGVSDWKDRIIPNQITAALTIIGVMELFLAGSTVFPVSVSERIFGMFIPGMILFFIYLYNPKLSGGGDLKLLASLGFCIGIYNFIQVMFIACIGGIAHSIIFKEKYIPLGSYVMLGVLVISVSYFTNLWR